MTADNRSRSTASAIPARAARRVVVAGGAFALLAGPALACDPVLMVVYTEDAPFDTLRLSNESAGAWSLLEADINLAPSAGKLLLDTQSGGAGTGAWHPFERVAGASVKSAGGAVDGSRRISLTFDGVAAGGSTTFAIDLDDTLPAGSVRTNVAFSEIEGATATARFIGPGGFDITVDGAFGPEGAARLEPGACS